MINSMYKSFQVPIYDKLYWVWRIEEKRRESSSEEDYYKTMWIYYSDAELPEGIAPAIDSDSWVPYTQHVERSNYEITFKQRTTTKYKWDDLQINNRTTCEIQCNGRVIYSFNTVGGSRGLNYAMSKSQYLITQMAEHPFNFFDPKVENGRKIWWYGLPATVVVWREDSPWEIGIKPDYTEVSRKEWQEEYANRKSKYRPSVEQQKSDADWPEDDTESEDFINWGDALSDQHIDWFRH